MRNTEQFHFTGLPVKFNLPMFIECLLKLKISMLTGVGEGSLACNVGVRARGPFDEIGIDVV